jgi:hypothetical protein
MIQLSKTKAAQFVGLTLKELNEIEKHNTPRFESIVLGATILNNGYMIGEVLFKMRHKFSPDVKAYEEENKMLWKRVKELEGVV